MNRLKDVMLDILLPLAHFTRRQIWRLLRPTTLGVKVLLLSQGRVLLVKTRYSSRWSLPGGKVDKMELPCDAAIRELREETGVIAGECRFMGVYSNFTEFKNDTIILYSATNDQAECQPGWEIKHCGFFPVDQLPADTSPATLRRLEEFKCGKVVDSIW